MQDDEQLTYVAYNLPRIIDNRYRLNRHSCKNTLVLVFVFLAPPRLLSFGLEEVEVATESDKNGGDRPTGGLGGRELT